MTAVTMNPARAAAFRRTYAGYDLTALYREENRLGGDLATAVRGRFGAKSRHAEDLRAQLVLVAEAIETHYRAGRAS